MAAERVISVSIAATPIPLAAGTKIGPYLVEAPLGAGGMGEVYRARDTRLDRTVAIKVLPDALAVDPQFRERFDREARTASHLNHPHICAVYDVGDFKPAGSGPSVGFLVMEYLEGETLAARLERGPLALDHVLRLGVQIATALDKAHRAGITHRDLKPANVMLTKSGSTTSVPQAKLLDFGLAKKTDAAMTMNAATMAAGTREGPLTQQGTILGTFQYMAPEQLEGQEADARTDIFAFGALLYEMTTGKKAFEGKNKTSLIAAIVGGQPAPVSAVQPLTPPALEHVIRKCLEKDPDDRWQSAHDIAEELRWISDAGSQAGIAAPIGMRRKTRETIAWAVAAIALVALAALAAMTLADRSEPSTYAFTMPRADNGFENAVNVTVSPDGKSLCFAARIGEGRLNQLFVRGVDNLAVTPLAGTEQATDFAWGLDSRSVIFASAGKVRVIDTVSAAIRDVLVTEDTLGAAINRDGVILLGSSLSGLRRVSKDGSAEAITTPDKARHEIWHGHPVFLPDGKQFLYVSFVRDPAKREQPHYLYAGSVESPQRKLLGEIPSQVKYVDPGYLVFVRDGTLMYVGFDAKSLTISGEPARLGDGVLYFKPTGNAEFSASQNGVITFRPPVGGQSLAWLDKSGKPTGTIGPIGAFGEVRFSTDGSEIIAEVSDLKIGTPDLWMFGTRRQTTTRLTFGSGYESNPVITPDGKWLFYSADPLGVPDVFVKQLGSAEEDKPFWVTTGEQYAQDISADGKVVLLTTTDYQSTGVDIFTAATDGGGKPAPFVRTPFTETNPRFSPDGKTVAYQSNETGAAQIYTKPFPGPGRARQVSTARGGLPRWSADGKQLFFRRANSIFVVDMTAADAEPRLLFETDRSFSTFEVAPDGRFLVAMNDESAEQVPTRVIVNWPAMVNAPRP